MLARTSDEVAVDHGRLSPQVISFLGSATRGQGIGRGEALVTFCGQHHQCVVLIELAPGDVRRGTTTAPAATSTATASTSSPPT